MSEALFQYFLVYISSTFKIILGMVFGTSFGFSVFTTATLTILGMMTSVYVITFFGRYIREIRQRFFVKKNKRIFSARSRRNVRIWQKYGVPGIAILTPILLMPVGGAILANAFGGDRKEIIKWMWISCIGWTYPLTWMVKFASHLLPFFEYVK